MLHSMFWCCIASAYSAVQINAYSDEMRQIFVKIEFNLKSLRNYLTNDAFNTKYDHHLLLGAFSHVLA